MVDVKGPTGNYYTVTVDEETAFVLEEMSKHSRMHRWAVLHQAILHGLIVLHAKELLKGLINELER